MTRDDAAPLPGDLLLQAVEGMERPLFVLDDDWRFRYVNPAGAAVLSRTGDSMVGGGIWEEFPETVDTPFERHYRRGGAPRGTGPLPGGGGPPPASVPGGAVPPPAGGA